MLTNHQAGVIIAGVADEFGIASSIITGRSRHRPHCRARWEAWRRIMALGHSSTEAGDATGHDHSTVLHGVKRLAEIEAK